MAKRILMLAPQPFFTTRGTPINAREMLRALSSAGYTVDILTFPFGEDIEIENVNIIRVANIFKIKKVPIGPSISKILLDIPFSAYALYLGIKGKYDLFHGIEEAGFIAGTLGLIKSKPFIFDVDSSMSDQLRSSGFIKNDFILKTFSKVERFFWKRAATNLTVCKALSDEILSSVPYARISQIEDFPVETQIGESGESEESFNLRTTLGLTPDTKIVLYAGNFEPYQGVELLLSSFALLASERARKREAGNEPIATLVLVGGDQDSIAYYKERVMSKGLEQVVKFTGSVKPSLMRSIHNQADILVSPRLSGVNTPLKLYSYLDSGKPLIATNISSHTQVIDDSVAYLADPNPESFCSKIKYVLDPANDTETKKKTLAAKELIKAEYSVNRFHEKIQSAYSKILTEKTHSATDLWDEFITESSDKTQVLFLIPGYNFDLEFSTLIAKSLSRKFRVLVYKQPLPDSLSVELAAEELLTQLNKKKIKRVTIFAAEGGFNLSQALSLIAPGIVRRVAALDPEIRVSPSFIERIIDKIESYLPLGLPLRPLSKHYDPRPTLHRLRCPVFLLASDYAGALTKSNLSFLNKRIPNSLLLPFHLTKSSQNFDEIEEVLENLLNQAVKRPQKNL